MERLFVALRALTFLLGFVLLWGWIALRISSYDRDVGIQLPAWTEVLGMIFMLFGGILALTCVGTFIVRGRGTPAPFDAPQEFVAVGPYQYVRNPMYIGALGVLIGFGLFRQSVSILLFSVVWFLGAHLFVIYFEEPGLRRKFGAKYEDYCKAVLRWVPRWCPPGKV